MKREKNNIVDVFFKRLFNRAAIGDLHLHDEAIQSLPEALPELKEADQLYWSASRMMFVREIVSLKYGIIPYEGVLITGHPAEISAMQR